MLGGGFELGLDEMHGLLGVLEVLREFKLLFGESQVALGLFNGQLSGALDLSQGQVSHFHGLADALFNLGLDLFQLVLHEKLLESWFGMSSW
jgi:hypothetical protein